MVKPPLQTGHCEAHDVCPSIFLPLDRIWDELASFAQNNMSHYVQNVGANDGIGADPLYPLLLHKPQLGGLYLEADPCIFSRLARNMAPFPNVRLVGGRIDPARAIDLLHRSGPPSSAAATKTGTTTKRRWELRRAERSIDIFKIDVDFCDCHVLEALLGAPLCTTV